jgi:lysophospholipase L1-like esterase
MLICAVLLSSALAVLGQQPGIPPTGNPGLDQYRASRIAIFTDDFGQLARYREANAALKPPAPGENRVVFFGDSITDFWHLDEYFPGKPYLNRGIGGQTTPQMLIRFRQDVVELHPKVVVILAGTNDIAGNTGPMRLEDTEADYASFADLARANNIFVIFSSVLPVHNYTPRSQNLFAQRSPEKILELNRWLKNYVAEHPGCLYLDYFTAMVDDKGLLKRDLADDGLHPNVAGYEIMVPLAEAAIEKALSGRRHGTAMNISYRITREDFVDAQKLHRSKGPSTFVRAIRLAGQVLVGSAFLILIVLAAVVRDAKLLSNFAPLIILLVAGTLVMLVWVPFNWRRSYAKDRRLQHEFTADISEDGIHLQSVDFDANLKWALYLRFLESDRIFLLYQTQRMFNLFPKAAVAPGEIDEFRRLVRRKLPEK